MTIGRRNALCLVCRTALLPNERCDVHREQIPASMDDAYGREALIAAVWGPVRVREANLRDAARTQQSLMTLASVGGVVGAVASWSLLPGVGILPLVGAVGTGALFWACGNRMWAKRAPHPFPAGADPLPEPVAVHLGQRGEVVRMPWPRSRSHGDVDLDLDLDLLELADDRELSSPVSVTPCIAYAVELHFEGYWGNRVMFRDAVTAGFDVALDSGRIARVPPGRLRLLGPMHQAVDVDNLELERYIDGFAPRRDLSGDLDPLRYNVVCEQVVIPGDRVELAGEFEPVVNADANPTHYREPAPSILAPRGVPILRLATAHG